MYEEGAIVTVFHSGEENPHGKGSQSWFRFLSSIFFLETKSLLSTMREGDFADMRRGFIYVWVLDQLWSLPSHRTYYLDRLIFTAWSFVLTSWYFQVCTAFYFSSRFFIPFHRVIYVSPTTPTLVLVVWLSPLKRSYLRCLFCQFLDHEAIQSFTKHEILLSYKSFVSGFSKL